MAGPGWDLTAQRFSDQRLKDSDEDEKARNSSGPELQPADLTTLLKQFVRQFAINELFIYRDQLLANYQQGSYFLLVDAEDVGKFNADLLDALRKRPQEVLPLFELALKDIIMLSVVPKPRAQDIPHIQVQLKNFRRYTDLRQLDAKFVSQLVCVRGIVVTASRVRVKATSLHLMCRSCKHPRIVPCGAGFGGALIPRKCDNNGAQPPCPLDPYIILPDSTEYIDQQRIKLQENPELVPTGEMPRHVSLSIERYLVGQAKPGDRISVIGIFDIFQAKGRNDRSGAVAIRQPYLRVVGISMDDEASEVSQGKFTPEEEEELLAMSRTKDVYKKIADSIGPEIYGSSDIKKAIACMLFGGSRKLLPDGMKLRGDINVLMLGDPSTAKSQFLKFASQLAPVAVYTSGKGSSAAGLTASVIRDPASGEFQLEGGALVLADGGLVCIDEFDKMRPQDRVAIHEAMEQQTISIAKAGITTILNSRTSVLAAANPVGGRYDDMKSATEQMAFQSTILSRFDLIFIVRDVRNEARDKQLAKYVLDVHRRKDAASDAKRGVFELDKLKKYIAYARRHRSPRLAEGAAEALKSYYVKVRSEIGEKAESAIPITVRQLEAIVRISESLAKMELKELATEQHVQEAIRLFQVSTYQAAASGNVSEEGSTTFMKEVEAAKNAFSHRVPISTRIGYRQAVSDLMRLRHPHNAIVRALESMNARGEIAFINQARVIARLK